MYVYILLGTWCTHAVANRDDVTNIPNNVIGLVQAATLAVNSCTAYRMLKDFVDLKENDFVIQNGANSGVGQSVIQIANAWKIKSINIVRNRYIYIIVVVVFVVVVVVVIIVNLVIS